MEVFCCFWNVILYLNPEARWYIQNKLIRHRDTNLSYVFRISPRKSSIKKSKNVFIFADKSRNIYETDKNTYNKLLTDNISKTYKRTVHNIYNKINKEAKTIANNYGVSERVDCLAKSNAFVSLKDHKPNFSSNPKCRLINPAKSEMGKISKYFLEQLNSKVRDLSSVNEW